MRERRMPRERLDRIPQLARQIYIMKEDRCKLLALQTLLRDRPMVWIPPFWPSVTMRWLPARPNPIKSQGKVLISISPKW